MSQDLQNFFNVVLKHEAGTYDDHNWYIADGIKNLRSYLKGKSKNRYPFLKKDLSEYTIGEVKAFMKNPRVSDGGQLWATGKYQIIPKTLGGLQKDLKIEDNVKYDKKTQDLMGLQLLLNRGPIKKFLEGKSDNVESAALSIAQIWSSVGVPYATKGSKKQVSKNESYYSGGGDVARTKTEDVQSALVKFRSKYSGVSFSGKLNTGTEEEVSENKTESGEQKEVEIQQQPPSPPPPDPRLQGSLRLEKVSGPGNIMGQIEAEVIFGEVIFGDIQFDEPGDYVIRAVPSDSNVEPLDFLITVLVNDNPPSEEKPQQEITGKRSIITQIDPPEVQLEPIKFPVLDNAVDENAQTLSQIGLTPFVWYNGFQIKETAIFNLQVFYNGFVPQCTMKFADLSGFLKKQGMPLADSTFDIFINSNSAVIKSIHLRFRIIDFKQNKDGSYTMSGQLNLRDFHKVNWKSYKGTSFETLRKISAELQLGFNSNINNTDDLMTWTNTGIKYQNFISEIIAHSYISDTSFVAGYIDFYYGLTFVDIEKEWSRDVTNDFGIDTGGLTVLNKEKKDTETQLSPLVLTNDIAMNYSNMYFERYTVQNFATNKSMESGHYTVTKYYDVNSKQFLIFDVNSETTQSDDQLILKGKPGDSEEIQTNYSTIYGGKVDLSNVHKNYLYAEAANHRNLNDMAKIVLTFQMPNPNFNLYKFQKIRIVFRNPAPSVVEEDMEQQRISGNWMIVDIAFVWNGGRIYQTVKAIRRELEKTVEEKQTQEVIKEEPIKEGNVNEQVTETPPNSIYKVDEVYIVEDASGKQYEVTVKEILDNGNEISGWLWEI
jgi:hypothetical protein